MPYNDLYRQRVSDSVKDSWKYREKVPQCPNCKCFLSKTKPHNCNKIKEKQRQRKLENPTKYWLGKKRPEFGQIAKEIFEGKKYKDIFGEEKTKEIIEKRNKTIIERYGGVKWGFASEDFVPHNKGKTKENYEPLQKMAESNSKSIKKLWENKEYRESQLKKIQYNRTPSGYEKRLMEIIRKHKLPYKYTGDFSFLIGYKNPDFINVNGEKIAIEVYDTTHKELYYESIEDYQQERIRNFSKYGWSVIFLDENDLKDENKIINKLR